MKCSTPVASVLIFGILQSGPVFAETCVPVRGKIINNAISASNTLGVVSMVYGTKGNEIKLRCALHGTSQNATPPALNFVHVVSCDDHDWTLNGQPIHSQLTFDTQGAITGVGGDGTSFTFHELSIPRPGGSGWFYGVTSGAINVSGTLFVQTGAIDMDFAGNVCTGRL